MSKTRKALLMLLALALLRWPLDMLCHTVLPSVEVNPLPQCVAGVLLSVVLLGWPAWRLRPWTSDRLTRRGSLRTGFALGAAAAVTVCVGFEPLDAAWQDWLGIVPDMMPAPVSVPTAMLYIIALAVVPAITEEIFFRGALLTSLLDGSRRPTAVVLTTLLFALMHGDAAHLPSHLAVSFVLTLLMLHTGYLAVPVAAHFFYNMIALHGMSVPDWAFIPGCACFGVLCGFLLARQPKMAHTPMKRLDGAIAAAAIAALAALYFV